ncbi:MAG: FG-GAP-like repeat-containing protein [Flavobacterium sp.]|nr:FG-GAP-like repeat-containing protein [Flavobacterium sp.]
MKKITLLIALLFLTQFIKAQDNCATAVPLTTAGITVVGPITGTPPTSFCSDANDPADHAEWYAYTPTQDYTVTVTSDIAINNNGTNNDDTRVQVYTGTCAALNCVTGDDDSGVLVHNGHSYLSIVTFNVTAGTTYYIAWDNNWNSNGFSFQIIENAVVIPPPTPVTFTGVTLASIATAGYYNKCVVDMNNDFLDDLVGVNATNIKINYQNADGTFTPNTITTTSADRLPDWSMAAGDYNKDGFNDLLYGSGNGLTLMKSNSTGTAYTEDTPGQYIFCQRTNFVDINNDGNLDVFSCHDVNPNVYYINNGAGGFTYYQSGVTPGAYSLGVTPGGGNYASLWTDYDNDGDVDMFISKCSGPPCELHRNDGNGVFTDVSALAAINVQPVQSWSSAIADFDNDGDMDILIGSNGATGHMFFMNKLDNTNNTEEAFVNITAGSGWDTDNSTNRDYIAYDFDNDGFVDVMGGGNKIMFNNGDMTFSPVNYPSVNLGSVGDFNHDGFLDIQNGNKLQMNSGNTNNWITVNLHGVTSNSNGIGARLEIYGSFGAQIRDIRSGEGFEFMSSLSGHFGIGQATSISKLVIKWPSGLTDVIMNPAINQAISVTENSSPLAVNNPEAGDFVVYPNPVKDVINLSGNVANIKTAQIFDLSGKLILTKEINNQTVSAQGLPTGTYILILKDNNGRKHTQKFLKS